MFFHYYN